MKTLFFTSIFFLTINSLLACLSATQNRIFPLGKTSKGLCVVETHLFRTEFGEKNKDVSGLMPAWGGVSYFKIYDQNYYEIYSKIIDTIPLFEEQYYEKIIENILKKSLALAKTFPDFEIATPKSISFCDYQEKCNKGELLFDTIHNKVFIQLPKKNRHEIKILFDSTSIATNLINYYSSVDESAISAKTLNGNLYINSVREFQIGSKKLIILHLGIGQTFELVENFFYPPAKEYQAKFKLNDINKSIFEEPILHHGHGFDFYIWE